MRPKFLIGTFIFIVVAVAILLWLRPLKQTEPIKAAANPPTQSQTPKLTNQSIVVSQIAANSTTSIPTTADMATISNKAVKTDEDAWQRAVETGNRPINFYGQVIDQDGNPLSGVKATVVIQHLYLLAPAVMAGKPICIERTTDLGGRFEIHGETGNGYGCVVTKDGYESEPNDRRSFASSNGSLQKPIIFRMWKTNIHEATITGDKNFQIVPDGRAYFVNLIDGTISESGNGDLKVWVKRPAQVALGQKYDWSCEMDAINGGILQETDPYSSMFIAPMDGYEQTFQFNQEIGSGWGDSTGTKRFYVSLHDGKTYGRISVEIDAYYNKQIPGMIHLSYAINPSGSRILW